ncbi:endonuclease/exonuclease/phosphatase family metal-dependent hydrolase [Haloactinospora alba]|uniref:Endonuclease/exonuclease/phosphatase family metal-dependent hydrolase n=1 Tax=Haloactinospora alba TaxID=405555 RepID=A0A543NME4_9ACTN|nr:endonuclease/exonuclease/phosphatase family protein [Haloactinospora alba]TQN33000.1 endonuclease/exonuclease/phosphatase family metal-dependent hydrolase [Haloactinospora alba]
MQNNSETAPAAEPRPDRPAPRRRRWPRFLLALLIAPWAVWAVVRLFGLETGFPLVPTVAFTPYAAVTAVIPLAAALLARWWWGATVAVAVLAFLGYCVVPRALPAPDPRPEPDGPTLRVLTVNTGFGDADPERVMELVREHDVDVLSLQELTPDAAEALSRQGVAEALPHSVAEPAPGAGGGALFARHPLERVAAPAETQFAMPYAELDVPKAPPVEVVSAHAMPPMLPGTIGQWEESLDALPEAEADGPLRVVAGDLNATLDHARLRSLLATGYTDAAAATGDGWRSTWPDDLPLPPLTIDHVLVDDRAAVTQVGVHRVEGTDHAAVLASLTLPAE